MSIGPASKVHRVGRGGCWGDFLQYARVAFRGGVAPGYRGLNFGFRFVRRAL